MGVRNSIDLEALSSRLRSAGQDVAQALGLSAQWLPTTIVPHHRELNYDKEFLQLFSHFPITALKIDANVSLPFSWTICSLQNLGTLIQKENAQHQLLSQDITVWKHTFKNYFKPHHWIRLHNPRVNCSENYCPGEIIYYDPQHVKMLQQNHLLPLVLRNFFAVSQLTGIYTDLQNVT